MKKRIADIKIGKRYRKDLGDIDTLADSMDRLGQLQSIVIDQVNNLIAGRRRIEAAKQLGWTTIRADVIDIPAILLGERDENAMRKDFTASEVYEVYKATISYEKKEAAMRSGTRTDLEPQGNLPTGKAGRARDKIAASVGVGRRTLDKIVTAGVAAEEEPEKYGDLLEIMDEGSPTKSMRELNKRKRQEEIEQMDDLPDSKYRVVYADPPWHYDNKGMMDNYGHAERHYATMTAKELCAMPIKERTETDAVLFLWATSPMLPDAFPVIKAWGFKYKSSFVWDKVRHNFGHYNSVRHEFLLIATRGSCVPEIDEKFDSVQVIEKSRKHSEKPVYFRDIIDTLYPHGKRIEMFNRSKPGEGWDTWGAEKQNS